MKTIGREQELKELRRLYRSSSSELVAVTGRYGIGKTFLIDDAFSPMFYFKHTGISDEEFNQLGITKKTRYQLDAFYASLLSRGYRMEHKPKDWLDAFLALIDFIKVGEEGARKVIFLDELPWLDTPKSGFMAAFSWFWNNYACSNHDIMVIVCGSSMSWMLDKIINARGGLYNRVTCSLHLSPLSLSEVESFLQEKNISFPRYEIAKLYMCFGGIPYYLNYLQPGYTVNQYIDQMFFHKGAPLRDEFETLFSASFDEVKTSLSIVKSLVERSSGYTRKELLRRLKLSDGLYFSKALSGLERSDFILKYVPYKGNKRKKCYKVIDPFVWFYCKHVENNVSLDENVFAEHNDNSWLGGAFENLCYYHLDAIKRKLGISGVKSTQFSYNVKGEAGAQIDLLIERGDRVLNLCEMKFYQGEYLVTQTRHLELDNKVKQLSLSLKKSTMIQPVLITTFGLQKKDYYGDYPRVVVLDDLFA